MTDFMVDTINVLAKQGDSDDAADNRLRLAWGAYIPDLEAALEFEQRPQLKLVSQYGLTDAGIVAYYPLDRPRRLGTVGDPAPPAAGRPVHPYDVDLRDNDDTELPADQAGEIVIRPLDPGRVLTERLLRDAR